MDFMTLAFKSGSFGRSSDTFLVILWVFTRWLEVWGDLSNMSSLSCLQTCWSYRYLRVHDLPHLGHVVNRASGLLLCMTMCLSRDALVVKADPQSGLLQRNLLDFLVPFLNLVVGFDLFVHVFWCLPKLDLVGYDLPQKQLCRFVSTVSFTGFLQFLASLVRLSLNLNNVPHLHLWDLFVLCTSMCLLRLNLLPKVLLHISHLIVKSLVWTIWWRFNLSLLANCLPHTPHENCCWLSPWVVNLWRFKLDFLLKILSHISQGKFKLLSKECWVSICLSTFCFEEKNLPHVSHRKALLVAAMMITQPFALFN